MKLRLLILNLILILLPATAGTFHCTWNYTDFTTTPVGLKEIRIQTLAAYGVNSPAIIAGDYRSFQGNSSGSLTVSNLVNGRSYRVSFYGPNFVTTITNSFDTNVTGLVNAADYIAAPIRDGNLVAYTQAQADARFVSTNDNRYVRTNATEVLSLSNRLSRITAGAAALSNLTGIGSSPLFVSNAQFRVMNQPFKISLADGTEVVKVSQSTARMDGIFGGDGLALTNLQSANLGGQIPNALLTAPNSYNGAFAGNARGMTNVIADTERPVVRPAKVNDYATYPSGGSLSNGMGYIYVDVIPLQTNWNGFSYWAGAVHHPRYGWVNPGLLCSSNGYDWQIPAGATMPWNAAVSEPGLGIVLNTNGTLYCYTERQTNGWSLLLQKTTDGVTRTAPVIVSSNAARRYDFPSAMQEPNGDISVWSTHNDGTLDVSLGIYYQRFDTTGTNLLAGPMRCNGLTNLWNQTHAAHLSVRRVGDYYYAVVKMQNTATGIVQMNPYALFSSLDATNWFMIQDTILNPVDYPKYPNYTQGPNSQGGLSSAARWWGVGLGRVRHNSGQPRFDLWAITGMDDEAFTNAHQICYYSDLAVPHARNTMHVGGIVVDNGGETLMDTRTHSQIQIGGGDNAFRIRKEYGHELTVSFGAPGLEANKFTFGGDNGDFSFKGTASGNGFGLTNINLTTISNMARKFGYVSVEDFGATGAGGEYSAGIQAAIYFGTNIGISRIYFPPGVYLASNTIYIPPCGGANYSLTNQIELFGNSPYTTEIRSTGSPMNTKDLLSALTGEITGRANISLTLRNLGLYGPINTSTRFANIAAAAAYQGAVVNIGLNTNYPASDSGGRLQALFTVIDNCIIKGHRYGLAITNGNNLDVRNGRIENNAVHNVVLAHVDTVEFQHVGGGSPLVTNRGQDAYSYYITGSSNSSWGNPAYYIGAPDSGVHKHFRGLEHEGPFMFADGARVTIEGGQFELSDSPYTPLTNGWCKFTNVGQYTVIGATISMPTFSSNGVTVFDWSTNTILFDLSGGAEGGLSLIRPTLGIAAIDATLDQWFPRWFRIRQAGDTPNYWVPWWSVGYNDAAHNLPTYKNTIFVNSNGVVSYKHVAAQHRDWIKLLGGEASITISNGTYYGNGAGLSGVVATTSLSTAAEMTDEFMGGTDSSGAIGALGWYIIGGTVAGHENEDNHPSFYKCQISSGASNQLAGLRLSSGNDKAVSAIRLNKTYDSYFVFKVPTTSTNLTDFFVGYARDYQAAEQLIHYKDKVINAPYVVGVFATNGTGNFQFRIDDTGSGAGTIVNSGVAVNNGWNTLRIRGTGTQNYMTLNGGTETLVAGNPGGTGLQPTFVLINGDTTANKQIWVDAFKFYQTVTR